MRTKKFLGMILAMVLAVACGCTKAEPEESVTENETVYTVREGYVTDLEDVIKLKYSNSEKTIVMESVDGAWFRDGDTEVWINQTTIYSIVKTASQMVYLDEIKDAKLADYGLDNPAYTITMENEDGFIVSLYIGKTEGENECHVTTDDKKVVYKVSNSIIGMLEFDDEKLLADEVDPMQYLKDMVEDEDDAISDDDGLVLEDVTVSEEEETRENPTEGELTE